MQIHPLGVLWRRLAFILFWGRAASSECTIAIFVCMFFGSLVFCARAQYDQGI